MSVMRIYQNPVALNANRNLKITGMNISKSLERMSSGLRINRAADDAAGLSISEKLRGQIRGLNRASSNALDGISLIQTAEGALNETHGILQRMRELSVQAANGIYTAGDRQAIQSEVGQLTDEINRIAKTTEFNTKSLLDGTMGALISTDDYTKVRAAVVGDVGAGGNFVLKAVAKTVGQMQIQKTDVFSTTQATDAVGGINYLATMRADATITTAGPDGIGNTGITKIEVNNGAGGSVAVNSTIDGTIRLTASSLAGAGISLSNTLQGNEISNGDKFLFTVNTGSGVATVSVGVSVGTNFTSLAALMSGALGGYVSAVAFNATGQLSVAFSAAGRSILDTKFVDTDGNGSQFYLSFGSGAAAASNAFYSNATVSFFNNGAAWSGTLSAVRAGAGQHFSFGDPAAGSVGTVHIKFDTRHDWSTISLAGTSASDTVKWNKTSGGNSLQDYGKVSQVGPVPSNGTFLVSAISARTYAVFEFDNSAYTSLVAAGTDQNIALAAARGSMVSNSTGGTTQSIGATFRGVTGQALENVRFSVDGILQARETATFNISTNNVLTGDQGNTLASLNRFQQFGVFNGKNNVEFQMYLRGTDKVATVNISKNDTFEDLANKISLALYNGGGTGLINSGILNPQELPDLVHVNTIGNAKGTMSITTAIPGAEVVFAGDEGLLKALSLIEVQEGKAPIYSVNAFNLEKNASVGSRIVDSNEITGLLPGLRVFFDNTLGLKMDSQPPINGQGGANNVNTFAYPQAFERPVVSLGGNVETFFVHVAPRDFTLQIGANEGQTISSFIGDMSAEALGVEGLLVVDSELAQKSISVVDEAINRVSSQRSRLGAIQNRLESTIRNLDVAGENLTASESRIRDTDVAADSLLMTRNQILQQAGTAALAQANQLPQAALQLLR